MPKRGEHLRLVDELSAVEDELAERRRREIEATFTPWYADREVLARLWTFLKVIDQQPQSVSHFLRHAEEYSDQYTAMLECEYPSLRGDL